MAQENYRCYGVRTAAGNRVARGMITASITLDRRLHHQVILAASKEGAAMTEFVREAVREWLARRAAREATDR